MRYAISEVSLVERTVSVFKIPEPIHHIIVPMTNISPLCVRLDHLSVALSHSLSRQPRLFEFDNLAAIGSPILTLNLIDVLQIFIYNLTLLDIATFSHVLKS